MPLEPLELDPKHVLAIVAHPDDLEYGAAALVAKWTGASVPVTYCLATRGEAGIDAMTPDEAARVRTQEQLASAAIVGVRTVEFLDDFHDGVLEEGLPLRRALTSVIRRHQPDTVILFNHRDSWGPGTINSADHRALGRAAFDAIADAGNRWIFPDLNLPAHKVRAVIVAGSPESTHAVDVSDTIDVAVESLAAHRTYLDGLGDHPMADPEWLRAMAEQTALQLPGSRAAVSFEVYRF